MEKHNNNFVIFILLVLLLYIIASRFKYNSEEAILVSQKQLTFGNIIDYGRASGRGGSSPKYKFKANGIEYIDNFKINFFCFRPGVKGEMRLSKIKIPIVYCPSNPEISRILLKKEDYERYSVPYPDSLPNVLVKYFECESQLLFPF